MWLRRELFVLSPKQIVWAHIVLQFLDALTTLLLVANTSPDVEYNLLMRLLLSHSYVGFVAAKILGASVLAYMIPWSIKRSEGKYAWIWRGLAILYFAIVLNNLSGVAILAIMS
jgi:hypothetical protein